MEQLSLVSVIIPTYSRPDNIVRAIDSVLAQTYKNIEIIVVDDNGLGTPYQVETKRRLGDYIIQGKIIYLTHEVNKNGSAARNTGFRASHGEYVNFLDDDDIFLPDKIERQVLTLSENKDAGATYCNIKMLLKKSLSREPKVVVTHNSKNGNLLKEYLTDQCKFNTSSILFRRSVVSQLNGFDESWNRHQDFELMVRFFRNNTIVCTTGEPLQIYDLFIDTKKRHNCSAQYALENRFLQSFEEDLKLIGAYKDVSYFLWMDCFVNSILASDKEIRKKSYKRLCENRIFYLGDTIRIIKAIFKSFFLKKV